MKNHIKSVGFIIVWNRFETIICKFYLDHDTELGASDKPVQFKSDQTKQAIHAIHGHRPLVKQLIVTLKMNDHY